MKKSTMHNITTDTSSDNLVDYIAENAVRDALSSDHLTPAELFLSIFRKKPRKTEEKPEKTSKISINY